MTPTITKNTAIIDLELYNKLNTHYEETVTKGKKLVRAGNHFYYTDDELAKKFALEAKDIEVYLEKYIKRLQEEVRDSYRFFEKLSIIGFIRWRKK